MALIGVDGSSL